MVSCGGVIEYGKKLALLHLFFSFLIFFVLPKLLHYFSRSYKRRLETLFLWAAFSFHWTQLRIQKLSFLPIMGKRRKMTVEDVSHLSDKSADECREVSSTPGSRPALSNRNTMWKTNVSHIHNLQFTLKRVSKENSVIEGKRNIWNSF